MPCLNRPSPNPHPNPILTPNPAEQIQGLRDGAYYAVNYLWQLGFYCLLMFVFALCGCLINLKMFTLNSYSVQVRHEKKETKYKSG